MFCLFFEIHSSSTDEKNGKTDGKRRSKKMVIDFKTASKSFKSI